MFGLLSGSTVQAESTYFCFLKVIGHVSENQKRKIINTVTTSVHLFKSASTDLTIKSDSVLTNPIGKDGVQCLLM